MAQKESAARNSGSEPRGRILCDTYGFGAAFAAVSLAAIVGLVAAPSLLVSDTSASAPHAGRAIAAVVGAQAKDEVMTKTTSLPKPLRSLMDESQWLNTSALSVEDLRGKVVLVNFWTYSCINSLRPLPYLRAWAEKYGDRGLIVVGVHTPEFAFERDVRQVEIAASELSVRYPVILDNEYRIWRSFENRAWPGFYFFDSRGHLRHHALGEGRYDDAERLIQKLLSEATAEPVGDLITDIAGEGVQAAADWDDLQTPETYVGYARSSNFLSPGGVKRDASKVYGNPTRLKRNHWSLAGAWTIGSEYASLDDARGSIAFRFHARDLHLVLGKSSGRGAIRFRVTIDGRPPGGDHGVDIDADGFGVVRQDRMYQLIRQTGPVKERTFEIEFLEPGARAYTFTFG